MTSSSVFAHGLVMDPPARNWYCGAVTAPDEVQNGTAEYPVCGDAFFADGIEATSGYSFMSVLTHTTGRSGVGPREHVCGFNSETWNGEATVWDQPIDWPTSNMTAGEQSFVWNISWGPHFSDTEEFRYWITKPEFSFQVGVPLSFDDFEAEPFCVLTYDDAAPNANPAVIPDHAGATFDTRCTVPERSGRHVIYAEWGRNYFTYERFHGCVDVVFDGTSQPAVDAQIAVTPNVAEMEGAGTMTLDGSSSVGTGLSYQWTVDADAMGLYTLANADQAVATLTLGEPAATQTVTITLTVTGSEGTDSATRTFVHRPTSTSQWDDLGALTAEARTLAVGDEVSVRTVSASGLDAYWPSTPLTITESLTAASAWPLALAQAVNSAGGTVRIGVLDASDNVVPEASATTNHIFSMDSANLASAFLQVVTPDTEPEPEPDGSVTVEAVVTTNSAWFNEQQVKVSNTETLTALEVTVVIQRADGVNPSGQYNTLGGQITQSSTSTDDTITYLFTLGTGASVSPGQGRIFAAQTGGTGTIHGVTGDTYTVTYTVDGVSHTVSGTF